MDYPFDITGGSSSSGYSNPALSILLKGGSGSYGESRVFPTITVLKGGSTSSGKIEDIPFGAGHSTSAGSILVSHRLTLSGGSVSSGGVVPNTISLTLAGGSTSSGTLDLTETAAMSDLACYVLNFDTKRSYQYSNYAFQGIGRFNGKVLGLRGNKIYDLETVKTTDDGTAISAYMDLVTDFGVPNWTAIRSLFAEDSAVTFTLTTKGGQVFTGTVTAGQYLPVSRLASGKNWTIRIANVSGSSVTIRRVQGRVDIAAMKGGN